MTVPAVLLCLGGRDGVSTAPWALCQPHRLYGSVSAPRGCLSRYHAGLSALHPATSALVPFFSSCDMEPSSCVKSEALQPKVGQ